MTHNLDKIILTHLNHVRGADMARASIRYEVLRRFTPNQFDKLWRASLLGEDFDTMVDMAVIDLHNLLGREQAPAEDKPKTVLIVNDL